MPRKQDLYSRLRDWAFVTLGGLVLIVCLLYGNFLITQVDPDFRMDPTEWVVTVGQVCTADPSCIREGDQVLAIDGVTRDAYLADRTQGISWHGGPMEIRFLRQNQLFEVILLPPENDSWVRRIEDVLTLLVSLVFWAVGTVAGLFMRPRDERWTLMVLFGYVTGLWFAAGALSATQLGFSVLVFHAASWLTLPLAAHLHLTLPTILLGPRQRGVLAVLYGVSGLGLWLDLDQKIPEGAFVLPVVASLAFSLAILIFRQVRSDSARERQASRLMLFGMTLGLAPWFLVVALGTPLWLDEKGLSVGNSMILRAFLLATVPLWPTTYLYASSKHTLGDVEFRANRLLGRWSYFACVVVLLFGLLLLGFESGVLQTYPAHFCLGVGLLVAVLGKPLLELCQRFFDRKVLGLRHTPDEILGLLAQNIPRLHHADALNDLLRDEILPTLMIRQSGIYIFEEGRVRPVDEYGVEVLTPLENEALSAMAQSEPDASTGWRGDLDAPPWARLILPLWTDNAIVGLWLVGRRDPDDFYAESDVALLRRVGNQLASLLRVRREILVNRSLEEQLFQSQKLEAIGRLSAGVAHDFSNMLSVIQLNSNFLRSQLGRDDEARTSLDGILNASEHAMSLVRQLLAFGRQQSMRINEEDLDEILQGTQAMLQTLLTDASQLEVRYDDTLPKVKVDRGRMEQVVVNLAINASHAMPDGGLLEIWTEYVEAPRRKVNETRSGGFVVLRVRDEGVGISEEVQQRMFEPFFTTKPTGQGTGLGLSIVYGILRQFGGHMTVDSEVGRGTTCSVWLPAVEDPSSRLNLPRALDDVESAGTILVVEDEANLRTALAETLELEGYGVLTASDGVDALELFGSYGSCIDLLLSDVSMPRLDGPTLAKRMADQMPELEVLFISGEPEQALPGRDDMPATWRFLRKPFSTRQLTKTVSELFNVREDATTTDGIRSDLP